MALQWKDRVLETSTTTGTGALTLAGAVAGFRTFASVCSVSDTAYYFIEAVNSQSVPTGEWETGLGTYSGANTLTRTTVLASSNGGAAVNFSAGTKRVGISDIAGARGTVPLGSAGAPALSFDGDSDTGVYSPGTDTISVSTAGAERVRITSIGRVGVGTTAPAFPLVVSDAGGAGLEISPNAVATSPVIQAYDRAGAAYKQLTVDASLIVLRTSGSEKFRVASAGDLQMGGANTVVDSNRVFRLRQYTVATLPAGTAGMVAAVTDALSPTFLATVTGGGSVNTPVYYNGTNWVSF